MWEDSSFSFFFLFVLRVWDSLADDDRVCALSLPLSLPMSFFSRAQQFQTLLTNSADKTKPTNNAYFYSFYVNFLLEFFCSASWCRRFHCGCSCTAHANEGKALQLYYKWFTRACSVNIYVHTYICFYLYVCQLECILKCCVCLQCEFYSLATQ